MKNWLKLGALTALLALTSGAALADPHKNESGHYRYDGGYHGARHGHSYDRGRHAHKRYHRYQRHHRAEHRRHRHHRHDRRVYRVVEPRWRPPATYVYVDLWL